MSLALALLLAASPSSDALAARLQRVVDSAFALGTTPGIAVAVVKDDATVFTLARGFADREAGRPARPDTLFYIASTTKALTATAAASLAAEGRVDLDAPVTRLLPALKLQPPLEPAKISLRDLLTHTHGISNEGPVVLRTAFTGQYTDALLVRLLEKHPPAPKGRAFEYGNIGYNVAGLALGAGVPGGWKRVVEREVLDPVGMRSTTAYVSKAEPARLAQPYEADVEGFRRIPLGKTDETMHSAGGHFSTVEDLALFLRAHLNGGRVAGRQALPAAAIAETHRKQADQRRTVGEIERFGWGLGWDLGRVDGELILHRFGGFPGYRSHVSFLPERHAGVVVLVNGGDLSSPLADAAALCLYDELLARADAAERRERRWREQSERGRKLREHLAAAAQERAARAGLPRPPSAYVGVYENPDWGRMTWTAAGDGLRVEMGAARSDAEVKDAAAGTLRVELTGGGSVARFVFADGAEKASAVVWQGQEFARLPER